MFFLPRWWRPLLTAAPASVILAQLRVLALRNYATLLGESHEALQALLQAVACHDPTAAPLPSGQQLPPGRSAAPTAASAAAQQQQRGAKARGPAQAAMGGADVRLWRDLSQLAARLGRPQLAYCAAERGLIALAKCRGLGAGSSHGVWMAEQLVALRAGVGDWQGACDALRRLAAVDPAHPW